MKHIFENIGELRLMLKDLDPDFTAAKEPYVTVSKLCLLFLISIQITCGETGSKNKEI